MKHYFQEKDNTSGFTCIRMVLSNLNVAVSIGDIRNIFSLDEEIDTKNLVEGAASLGLYCKWGEFGQISTLDHLTSLGWNVIVAYSLQNKPHYACYHSSNGSHVFLNDPSFKAKYGILANKFIKNWKIDQKKYEKFKSIGWFAAFKK